MRLYSLNELHKINVYWQIITVHLHVTYPRLTNWFDTIFTQSCKLHAPYFILFALVHCDLYTDKFHTCTVESKYCWYTVSKYCWYTDFAKPNNETYNIFTLFCLVTYAEVYCSTHRLQVTCPLIILIQQTHDTGTKMCQILKKGAGKDYDVQ